MKILFCTPANMGLVHWKYHQSVLTELFLAPERLLDQERYAVAQCLHGGYSGLGKDRGIMASQALRGGFDKVMFVDSDQSWKWEQLRAVLDSKKPVIAGLVGMKFYPMRLNITTQPQDAKYFALEDGVVTPLGVQRWRETNPGQNEMQVSAAGTGFMCIDVSVLRKIAETGEAAEFVYEETDQETRKKKAVRCWDFFPSGVVEKNYFGEDYGFCILAQRAGFEVWVNTAIHIPHYGGHTYDCGDVWKSQGDLTAVDPRQGKLPFTEK